MRIALLCLPLLLAGCAIGKISEDRWVIAISQTHSSWGWCPDADPPPESPQPNCLGVVQTYGFSEVFGGMWDTLVRVAGSVFGASGELPEEITVRMDTGE